jgi:hypothetical protein
MNTAVASALDQIQACRNKLFTMLRRTDSLDNTITACRQLSDMHDSSRRAFIKKCWGEISPDIEFQLKQLKSAEDYFLELERNKSE